MWVDNPALAYEQLKNKIKLSDIEKPLFIFICGLTQLVGQAIAVYNAANRKFVTK